MKLYQYLLQQAHHRLQAAKPHLHLVPTLAQQHQMLSLEIRGESRGALWPVLKIWWAAFCIERSAYHTARAEACRE